MVGKCKSLYDSVYIKIKDTKMNNVLFRNTYPAGETILKTHENSKHRIENSRYLLVGARKGTKGTKKFLVIFLFLQWVVSTLVSFLFFIP